MWLCIIKEKLGGYKVGENVVILMRITVNVKIKIEVRVVCSTKQMI